MIVCYKHPSVIFEWLYHIWLVITLLSVIQSGLMAVYWKFTLTEESICTLTSVKKCYWIKTFNHLPSSKHFMDLFSLGKWCCSFGWTLNCSTDRLTKQYKMFINCRLIVHTEKTSTTLEGRVKRPLSQRWRRRIWFKHGDDCTLFQIVSPGRHSYCCTLLFTWKVTKIVV